METIICDTNVWYDLAGGVEDLSIIKNSNLVLTQVAIQEICTSARPLTKPELFIKTCEAIISYPAAVCLINPYDYLVGNYIIDEESRCKLENINKLVQNQSSVSNVLNENISFKRGLKQNNDRQVSERSDLSIQFHQEIYDYRKRNSLFNRGNISKYRQEETRGLHVKLFLELSFEYQFIDVDWQKHIFFISVFDHWMKRLLTGEIITKPNDWEDYLNLIYVEPGTKYLTHEKQWILNIWDSGMKDYLFIDSVVERILRKSNRIT